MPEAQNTRSVADGAARLEYDLQLYYWMKLIRAFEERVSRLHRQNKILGGVYSGAGQEAIVAGICAPLQAGDLSHGVFGSTSMLGSSLPVAAGAALKFQIKKDKNVAVAFFGEGASSRGDVHEAMNFVGVRKLPVIFVCENNRYAYSTPVEKQMAIDDVADRAPAYGFRGHV